MKWWVYAGFWLGLGACAAPPPRVAAPPSQPLVVQHSAPKPAFAARGTFDASAPVAGVMLWMRVANPARDIPVLGQLTGVGAVLDPTEILKNRLGPTLGAVVNQELPMDLSANKADDMNVVLAGGIDSVDSFIDRTRAAYDLVPVADGRWRLAPKESPDPSWFSCELWQAAPPVNARLLCSDDPKTIAAHGPFLLSQHTKTRDGVSLHVEFPTQAFKFFLDQGNKKAKDKREDEDDDGDDKDDSAGDKLSKGTVDQLAAELTVIGWDVTLGDSSVQIKQDLGFSKTEGLLSLLISGHAAPHAAVPEAFWRLPAESDLALYFEGADPKPLRAAWSALVTQMVAIPDAEFETPAAYRARQQRVLEGLGARGGAGVYAYGQDLQQTEKALEVELKPAKSAALRAQLEALNGKLQGWFLLGLEDDPEQYIDSLRELAKLSKVKNPPRKKSVPGADAANEQKNDPPSESNSRYAEVPLKKPSTLPKGSALFVIETRPNPKYPRKPGSKKEPPVPTAWHVLAVPDGKYVWLSLARDEASATSRAQALFATSGVNTLASNAELRQAASGSVSGIGYASIAGILALSLKANSTEQVTHSLKQLSSLWRLPAKGATHVPFSLENDGGNGVGRRLSLSTRLTPDAISDLLQLIMGAALEGK